MIRNIDIRQHEQKIISLELTIGKNEDEIYRYRKSIHDTSIKIESLGSELSQMKSRMEDEVIELNVFIKADKDERCELKKLTTALDTLKNGKPDVKAFNNPRPVNEQKISFFSGVTP